MAAKPRPVPAPRSEGGGPARPHLAASSPLTWPPPAPCSGLPRWLRWRRRETLYTAPSSVSSPQSCSGAWAPKPAQDAAWGSWSPRSSAIRRSAQLCAPFALPPPFPAPDLGHRVGGTGSSARSWEDGVQTGHPLLLPQMRSEASPPHPTPPPTQPLEIGLWGPVRGI